MKLSEQIAFDFQVTESGHTTVKSVSCSYLLDLIEKVKELERRIVKYEGWFDS